MQFFLGVLRLKIHIGVFGMINKWKYSKLQKSPFMVTMATACIRELYNAYQKISYKILGKVVKFWL